MSITHNRGWAGVCKHLLACCLLAGWVWVGGHLLADWVRGYVWHVLIPSFLVYINLCFLTMVETHTTNAADIRSTADQASPQGKMSNRPGSSSSCSQHHTDLLKYSCITTPYKFIMKSPLQARLTMYMFTIPVCYMTVLPSGNDDASYSKRPGDPYNCSARVGLILASTSKKLVYMSVGFSKVPAWLSLC
eukprot:scpid40112/ scgid8776/ 